MRIPVATYRLQFCPEFGFEQAKRIVSYLAELGISDIYASPIFKARSGSTHGYDVVDPNILNPELGTEEEFDTLISEIQEKEMGWVQDIVPNHMAYNSQNKYLMDILEHGEDSEYFPYFDIDWEYPYEGMRSKVLTPMLGDFYGNCLEKGELQLSYDPTGLTVNYYELKVPLRIESYATFLYHDFTRLSKNLGKSHPDVIKMLGLLYIVKSIPTESTAKERKDQSLFVKSLLWELYNDNEKVKRFIDRNLEIFNGEVGKPETFDLLDRLLSEQFFRLSFWKVGAEELNYRRFFTVNELICVRIEDKKVFKNTHKLISKLVEEGKITGLRIDHIDGLYDPYQYLNRLREQMGDVYIVAEKILELEEELPNQWPIQGTSGYDFLNQLNGIFTEQKNAKDFTEIYHKITDSIINYHKVLIDKKRLIAETNLVGDIDNLAVLLKRNADRYRYGRDFTLAGLKKAILEVLVHFPIYCTYINRDEIHESDGKYVKIAIKNARKEIPQLLNELNFIEKLLLLDYDEFLTEEAKTQWLHFVMRLQQFTGPLMAKGIEDTLFYSYNRLLSLNEVGGYPQTFGVSVKKFHNFNQKKLASWPHSMNASSTHDTKRSEDVRARLNVISEIPGEWEEQINHWREINQEFKTVIEDKTIPDDNDEYFLYQNLLGAYPYQEEEYPEFVQRIKDYVVKAVREAKVHTAWLRNDTEYEQGYIKFVEQILEEKEDNEFLNDFRIFQKRIAAYGMYNSLSQTLLKIASPGMPDFYQGTELWDLSLVDPDNRRPVDYDERLSFLQEIKRRCQTGIESLISDLKLTKEDGRMKLFLITRALEARKQYLSVFQQGDYQPLEVMGKYANSVVALKRHYQGITVIIVVPRLLTNVISWEQEPLGEDVWGDTYIDLSESHNWIDTITNQEIDTGHRLPVGKILQDFPAALLINQISKSI